MRIDNLIGVLLLASFTVSAAANTAEPAARMEGRLRNTTAVESTGLPWSVSRTQRVSPALPEHYPPPHWTALIGTGAAGLFDAGLAVSMFHDALELLLAATAQKVGAIVSKNQINFFAWWDLIEKAPNAGNSKKLPPYSTLRLLNDARVSFKHFGRCPPVGEAQTHQVTCEQFLTQVCTDTHTRYSYADSALYSSGGYQFDPYYN